MTTSSPTKIMVVGMLDSIHLARWLENAKFPKEFEVILIPTSPMRKIHPRLKNWLDIKKTDPYCKITLSPWLIALAIPLWLADRDLVLRRRLLGLVIRSSISKYKPGIVHLLESQGAGYGYLQSTRAQLNLTAQPRIILTLFGSDLFWFSQFPKHKDRLQRLLYKVDFLSTECSRDLVLARTLGFTGQGVSGHPVGGGLQEENIVSPSAGQVRDIISIKGYGGTWGLGHLVIPVLAKHSDVLREKKVVIYSASRRAARACRAYLGPLGVTYEIYKKHSLTQEELLEIFRSSLMHIGISKSDGLPASMLESMSQGAFPIQSRTACIDGWFEHGVSGLATEPNTQGISQAIEAVSSGLLDFEKARAMNVNKILQSYNLGNLGDDPSAGIYLKFSSGAI